MRVTKVNKTAGRIIFLANTTDTEPWTPVMDRDFHVIRVHKGDMAPASVYRVAGLTRKQTIAVVAKAGTAYSKAIKEGVDLYSAYKVYAPTWLVVRGPKPNPAWGEVCY